MDSLFEAVISLLREVMSILTDAARGRRQDCASTGWCATLPPRGLREDTASTEPTSQRPGGGAAADATPSVSSGPS